MNEINMTHKKLSRNIPHRLGMLILALCMALTLLPVPPVNAAFSDAAMDKLLNWGVVNGYPDGALHPDRTLTRAEFVAMVNRAYGYDEIGNTPFIDVPDNAWFHDDVSIGYTANYFTGVSPRMAGPDQQLTREQAVVLLARNMRLTPIDGEITEFSDGHAFSDWSRGYVRAARAAGVIGGYSDGSYKPKNSITRGEMAVMLQRALGTLINKPGTHTLSDVYGNVTISSTDVLLKDSTIAGDLYITGGLSLGDVTLQNVRVLGKIVVAGGGESQSGESIILRNVQADALIVDSIAGQYVSLASEGDTAIAEAILRTSAYVQDRTRPGEGLLQITLDSLEEAAIFTLSGNLEKVVNKTPNSMLNVAMGTVDSLTIDELARSSGLHLDINSTVKKLNLDTATTVTGVGDIGDLFVNAPGVSVEMLPDTVTIRPGLTADVAGQTMNALQAQESSADPRLQAGYPKVKNIAPTNATSVYSANKGGTVYWAVSNTTDGSIGEAELIEPTAENTRIVLSGTTTIEQSNTEYTAALERLTPDSNYYLSTVMSDARGRHSPIKVVSFATPDNTVPAFAQGYPVVMKNYSVPNRVDGVVQRDEDGFPVCNYRVQVAAMPNKSCVLYYAVYPAGSTAPTAQQFRTGALGTPIRSGMEDASKNRINFVELTGLEELTTYDIYLCYIDADGSRSSPVQKLTFTTVDGKPPRFQYETPIVMQEQLNGLRLNANVNENATIYWVATRNAGYINDNADWSDTEWWERACRQIESGTGGISSGNVAARANTDVAINITGLQPATRYYIYFVAKDAAGNYSEFFRAGNPGDDPDIEPPQQYTPHNQQPYKYYLMASTLDNIPPTATQEFTRYDAADPTRPYADTDIQIHFSEAVMQYSTHRDKTLPDDFRDFEMLYKEHVKARAAYDDAVAAGVTGAALTDLYEAWSNSAFVSALRSTIKLYNNAASANESVEERNAGNEASIGDDWVIDYRYATVSSDDETGVMTVVFPSISTDPNHPENVALNLSSGATYHFVLDDICDVSSSKNRMGRYPLPDFTTISAQVQLRSINVTRISYTNKQDGNKVENIPIDMAFSMTPLSTSVEDDVDWDLLFWSDTSVAFEVYELDTGSNGTTAVVTHPLTGSSTPTNYATTGHHSVDLVLANVEAPDPDTTADNYRGYLGRSYFNEFYGVRGISDFPSVTGKGNVLADYKVNEDLNLRGVMQRNVPKYYGIRFTRIDDVSEAAGRDKVWDATVNFRISVVTASNDQNLYNLATNINNTTITAFDGDAGQGGSIIHSPRPFTMRKQFANQDAPNFDPNHPRFNPLDTSVDMTLMLDRPGTVYYVIAPASTTVPGPNNTPVKTYTPSITTKAYHPATGASLDWQFHSEITSSTSREYEHYYFTFPDVTVKGSTGKQNLHVDVPSPEAYNTVPPYSDYDQSFDTTTTAMTSKLELTEPANSLIYGNRYFNARTKTGSVELGSAADTITVDGLEPETVYFVYFVMQGQGQVYSERAQLFQFTTTKVRRPILDVAYNTSSAFITSTNMTSTVNTALFFYEDLGSNSTLGRPLSEVIDPLQDPTWSTFKDSPNPLTGRPHSEDTIWQALASPYGNDQGSVFDQFATETFKDQVAQLISGSIQTGGKLAGDTRTSLPQGTAVEFTYPDIMEPGGQYILLAVASGQEGATGHSRGFGAAYPLYMMDSSKPVIKSVGGEIEVDYKTPTNGGYIMNGHITLTFYPPLYLYHPAVGQNAASREPLTGGMLEDYFITSDTTYFKPKNGNEQYAVSDVTINVTNLTGSASFTVTAQLCSQFGTPRQGQPLVITVSYDPVTRKVTASVQGDANRPDADKWFPDPVENCDIFTRVIAPDPTGFSVTPTNITLNEDESRTITATLSPTGAEGRVDFQWAGDYDTVADITWLSNTSVQVTAGSVEVQTTRTIIATLCYLNGQPVLGSNNLPITRSITVTVRPANLGRVEVDPQRVNVSKAGGPSQQISVRVNAPGAPNQRLSSEQMGADAVSSGANSINKVIVEWHRDLDETSATVFISCNPNYTPAADGELVTIYFPAVDNARITRGQLSVWLTR